MCHLRYLVVLNPGNAAVGVLAGAKIFTKGSFNRMKTKNKKMTLPRANMQTPVGGCLRNGLPLLMPAEYFWNRALESLLSRGQQD